MKKLLFLFSFFPCFSYSQESNLYTTRDGLTAYINTTSVAYIFAHGLGGNFKQAFYYLPEVSRRELNDQNQCEYWIVNKPLLSFDFPETIYNAEHNSHQFYQEKVTLGQHDDIECLKTAYEASQIKLPHHSFIGVGVSRGAATWLNFCALHKPTKVRALVLESPFDTPLSVIHNYIKFLPGASFITQTIGNKILNYKFPAWNEKDVSPLDVVDKIPQEIPIFIFHSEHDSLIPVECSKRLCQKLADSHHEVYLLVVKQGDHAHVFFDKKADICTMAIHAFYKKYNLPCNEKYAQQGECLLAWCKVE